MRRKIGLNFFGTDYWEDGEDNRNIKIEKIKQITCKRPFMRKGEILGGTLRKSNI